MKADRDQRALGRVQDRVLDQVGEKLDREVRGRRG